MKELPIRLTPMALLLTVISICMTVLGILTCATARADVNLAETYAETVRTRYELEVRGQNWIGGLTASADGQTSPDEDGVIREEFRSGSGLVLHAGAVIENGRPRIVEWRFEQEWEEDTSIGKLWDGTIPG